jgi:hypothetical protein
MNAFPPSFGPLVTLRPAAFALAALLFACGGQSQNPPGGSSSGSGSSSGGGSGGSSGSSSGGESPGCPSSPPASNTPCTIPLSCEYGDDPDPQCNTLASCENDSWTTSPPIEASCPTSPPGTRGCPVSFSQVPVGQACVIAAECAYPQGRCACTEQVSGPAQPNGGSTWVCETPGAGCPEPRPLAGTSCNANPNLTCDYGACTLPGGVNMQCTDGAWVIGFSACPDVAGAGHSSVH